MISAFVIFNSGEWTRNFPPSTPAFVAKSASFSNAFKNSGRQSG